MDAAPLIALLVRNDLDRALTIKSTPMRNSLRISAILMLTMCVLMATRELTDFPTAGMIFSIVAALTSFVFFPVVFVIVIRQEEDVMDMNNKIRLSILSFSNSAYSGLLFAAAFTDMHDDLLYWSRLLSVVFFIATLPWFINHFDHGAMRWFMGASIIFYAAIGL